MRSSPVINQFRRVLKTYVIFSFLSILSIGGNCQTHDVFDSLKIEAKQFYGKDLDSALFYYDILFESYKNAGLWEEFIEINRTRVNLFGIHDKPHLAKKALETTEFWVCELQDSLGETFSKLEKNIQADRAGYYRMTGQNHKALEVYLNLYNEILIQPDTGENYLRELENFSFNLASLYKIQGNYEKAIGWFLKSLEYRIKFPNNSLKPPVKFMHFNHIATCYRAKKNYKEAEIYYLKATQNIKEILKESSKSKTNSIQIWAFNLYTSFSDCYRLSGDYEKAKACLDSSLVYSKASAVSEKRIHNLKGGILRDEGNYEEALRHFNRVLKLNEKDFKSKHPTIVANHLDLGKTLLKSGSLEKALGHFQEAIIHLSGAFNSSNYEPNPEFQDVLDKKTLLSVLDLKSFTLVKLSEKNQNESYSEAAFQTTMLACNLLDTLKSNITSNSDKQFLLELSYPIFERAIQLSFEKGDFRSAFYYSEKSKSVILFEAVKSNTLQSLGEKEESLLEEEAQLKTELASWEKNLFKEKSGQKRDKIINECLKEIGNLHSRLHDLTELIKKKIPEYAKIRYGQEIISVEEVQSELADNQSLIEYFAGDSSVFLFLIQKNNFTVKKIENAENLNQLRSDLMQGLYLSFIHEGHIHLAKKYRELYEKTAYQLYKKLVFPVENFLTTTTKITIIPDGILGYLPFGAFLMSLPEENSYFDSWDYLDLRFIISYGFSASLQKEMKKSHSEKSGKNLLALAPNFPLIEDTPIAQKFSAPNSNYPTETVRVEENLRKLRSEITPLLYNIEEADAILQICGGESLTGNDDTIDNFISAASNYRILHLSTHGKANDENGGFSVLIFKSSDGVNYDSLFTIDLFDLKLPADMVVLSACETGVGELQRGEGIVSLARGFTYAGAKSLVTSLWNVSDDAAKTLMTGFYENLKAGMTKDRALFEAKKQFLKNPESQHNPFYWTAFVPVGNMEPLTYLKNNFIHNSLIGALVILGLILLFFYVKSRINN